MILKVADSVVDRRTVTFSELSYGKREPSSYVSFQIYAESSEWEDSFRSLYDGLLEELKRDDEKVGGFNPPYKGALCYPSANELMNLPQLTRMEFIKSFLIFDFLKMFLVEDDCKLTTEWIISEVSDISQGDGSLIISGFVSPLR